MSSSEKNNSRITVLYIAGSGRNGSTLMERMLNEIPNVFAAGELGYARLSKENNVCFCGKTFADCSVWGSITKNAQFKALEHKYFSQAIEKYSKGAKTFFRLRSLNKKQKLPDDFKQYLNSLEILYSAIHKNRAAKVITDSTTLPLYGYHLSLIPLIDLYIVHLIRDPRGVANSRNRQKFLPNSNVPTVSKTINPILTVLSWIKKNLFIEFIFSRRKGRYLRIHYEDFIENPSKEIKKIGSMLGLELNHLDLIEGNKIKLGECHLSAGNIGLLGKEEIVLKLDERWKHDMKWWNIVLVTLITWPLLLKYFIVDKMMKKKRV